MQSPDILEWELELAKKNPTKINLKFDSRLYSWKNKILPGRLAEIILKKGSPDYIYRMTKLLFADKNRLFNRAWKEYSHDPLAFDLRIDFLTQILIDELIKYRDEIKVQK